MKDQQRQLGYSYVPPLSINPEIKNVDNIPIVESFPSLTPHVYPVFVRLFACITLIFFLITTMHFFTYHLPIVINAHKQLKQLECEFTNKNFSVALVIAQNLLIQFPKEKKLALWCSKICFQQSEENSAKFLEGFSYLSKIKLKTDDLYELKRYVPNKYLKIFEDSFVTKLYYGSKR